MKALVRIALAAFVTVAPITFAMAQNAEPAMPVVEEAPPALPAADARGAPANAEASPFNDAAMSEVQTVDTTIDAGTLPRDLSPWGMFTSADRVVQSVIIGLAFASVLTWTVWLVKSLEIMGARFATHAALRHLQQVRNLDEAAYEFSRRKGPAAQLVASALQEAHLSADLLEGGRVEGIKERIAARLARVEAAAGRRLARGTGVLASIGATAPFVGLFGTVWGIMNSFIGISEAETTNLAVVAPGIAEALLATAFGLVAAIPAVVIYNLFARMIAGHRARLGDASAAVLALSSRDLDRGFAPRAIAGLSRAAE